MQAVNDKQLLSLCCSSGVLTRSEVQRRRGRMEAPPPPDMDEQLLYLQHKVPAVPQLRKPAWLSGVCWDRDCFACHAVVFKPSLPARPTHGAFLYAYQNPLLLVCAACHGILRSSPPPTQCTM